ncbi:P83/100 family protein [Spirochaeta cellobiosiphila]|uniref:P83/100 family protein n=1 Tax=Spirochaeta cellobiosiphila TaxID=504483 RepID=UPI000400DEFB|nr:P83/100 family protein [Spirochaeta cellobiosiphila]
MYKVMLSVILIFFANNLYSQDVARNELESVADKAIEFTRYVGPHSVIQSANSIASIGSYLGRESSSDNKANYADKYIVNRYIEESSGFNGDVISITSKAEVDDIDNLRRILSGYFQQAYEYNPEEALLLAKVVTIYNAVYRKKLTYFIDNYVPSLSRSLEEENVGLSTHWEDWAGHSQIIVPLRNSFSSGDNSKLDTDSLTTQDVINDIGNSDEGLETRKDITELKENEIQEDKEAVDAKEEELQQRQEALDNNEQNLSVKDKQEEQEAINQEKTEVDEAKADIAQREEQLAKERDDIAQEEQAKIQNEQEAAKNTDNNDPSIQQDIKKVLFLEVNGQGEQAYAQLVIINAETKDKIKESALNTVRGRRFEYYGNSILVVAGREDRGGAVKLILLDSSELGMILESDVEVFGNTLLLQDGQNIYAVVKSGSDWVLGLLNSELKLVVESEEKVYPYTAMELAEGKLYLQSQNGSILSLDPKTLR